LAVVSSFGADSAALLSLVATVDASIPVLFLDTGRHFPETLAYRQKLARVLGLTDVRDISPDAADIARVDPVALLADIDPDRCCAFRKVAPLKQALMPFDAWLTGRRRAQSATRAALPFVEADGARFKLNPIADWSRAAVDAEFERRALPRHPLRGLGYPSIGCAPCTRAVAPGEDQRAGRWAGHRKVECGIHLGAG
jgi:phosphoadenosine phosphosulfate reductase